MSGSFVKIYGSILDSSVWGAPDHVRILWITLLAMADAEGIVEASIDGLARRSVLDLDRVRAALDVLTGPDPYSRDGTTGERVEKVPGGWLILNHRAYRDRRTPAQMATAERVRRHRANARKDGTPPVTGNDVTAEAEAEADPEEDLTAADPSSLAGGGARARGGQQHQGKGRTWAEERPDEPPRPEPALSTWGALVRGYADRREQNGEIWMAHDANRREIDAVAAWLDANGVDVEAWLDAWFADDWARAKRWPWKHAAKDPARFVPAATRTEDREIRKVLEAIDNAKGGPEADRLLEELARLRRAKAPRRNRV